MATISFRTTEERERSIRYLALKHKYANKTEYLNALIEREIEKLTPEEIATLQGDGHTARESRESYGESRPKTQTGRQRANQVAK